MTAFHTYFRRLAEILDEVALSQANHIETAAEWVAETIMASGVVHLFGSGHSHMVAEEVFHRSGSLLPLNPMLDANLTFLGHLNATALERSTGYGKVIVDSHDIRPGEVVVVISNSGVNPVPVEVALAARDRGARTVSISSVVHYADVPARTTSGQRLSDVVDLAIDTCVPRGDAVVEVAGSSAAAGGVSSAVGIAIINGIVVEAAANMSSRGFTPPLIPSMNVPDGDEHMEVLVAKYGHRLPLLRHA
jgi:uncharacterized phosphosugar-binding protein